MSSKHQIGVSRSKPHGAGPFNPDDNILEVKYGAPSDFPSSLDNKSCKIVDKFKNSYCDMICGCDLKTRKLDRPAGVQYGLAFPQASDP